MAKPRIFISSTFYDLKHVREDIALFVKEQGYDPILFEKGEIPYGRNEKPEEYCYVEIGLSDILISIIGGRYGSESSAKGYSVTQKELKHALEQGKQVYIFVEKAVLAEYDTYKINKDNMQMKFRHADDRRVYEFLDEIYQLPRNNPVFGFESSQEIVKILTEQWAGLFQRLLRNEEETSQAEIIQTLKNTVLTLQNMVNVVMEKNENQQVVFEDIILFNHPAFSKIKEILSIKYRVSFTNYEELNELFKARGYKAVKSDPLDPFSDESDTYFYWHLEKNDTEYGVKVSKSLFDGDLRLKPQQDSLEKNMITKEELALQPVKLEIDDDDLPF